MSTAAAVTQELQLQRWRDELEEVTEEARLLAEGLSDGQLRWRPGEKEWSIAEVFQHLADSNGSYIPGIHQAIERSEGKPRRHVGWRPSVMGGFMIRSLQPSSTRRLPTPKIWRPGPEPRQGAVEAFLRVHDEISELTHRAEGVDLVTARTRSPATALVRLNLGDCFEILVVHVRRHMGQIRRIMERPGFPRA